MSSFRDPDKIKETIRDRRTIKLKADPENPLPVKNDAGFNHMVEEIIETAGFAPFHYTSADFYQKSAN